MTPASRFSGTAPTGRGAAPAVDVGTHRASGGASPSSAAEAGDAAANGHVARAPARGAGTPGGTARPVAIITGASAGIGAATAVEFARKGYDLLLVARRADALGRAVDACRAAGGEHARAEGLVLDVAAAGASEAILDAAEERLHGFDVVFANAGYGVERPMTATSPAELRAMFETNFFASVGLCTLAAQRLVAEGRGGHLLLCSSCVAKFTLPSFGAYSASKAAQAHVARAMAHELRPHGIRVSSVHPVTTRTEFFDVVRQRSGEAPLAEYAIHGMSRFFAQSPERVARAVVRSIGTGRTEVWTSLSTRLAAGVITAFPGVFDLAVRLSLRRR
jgi:short-subunit dehydrogenase